MKTRAILVVFWLIAASGCDTGASDNARVENEADFLKRCIGELLQTMPEAGSWADEQCASHWARAVHSAALAEAILVLASVDAKLSQDGIQKRLPAVQWSPNASDGTLGDLAVYVPPEGGEISFHWQKQGSEVPYDLINALRIRNLALRTLGCPRYPGASMGREKVMHASAIRYSPFTVTVYSRAAPTGIDFGIYSVDVNFDDEPPDLNALETGRYPGGGGRAFAVDAAGWELSCADPE